MAKDVEAGAKALFDVDPDSASDADQVRRGLGGGSPLDRPARPLFPLVLGSLEQLGGYLRLMGFQS